VINYTGAQTAKAVLALAGLVGTKTVLPLTVDKIVTTANMKNGAYTIAAQPDVPARLTVHVSAAGAADTMGTIVFVGTRPDGTAIIETVIPSASAIVSTVNEFAAVTSATGAGWSINEGNDTLTIGVGEIIPDAAYYNAITDRIVNSANMKVGSYTVAAQPLIESKLTVAVAASGAADTMGTITISGVSGGIPISEVVVPVADSSVSTVNKFSHVYSVVGAGWVIDEGNDTIMVGVAEVNTESNYFISGLAVMVDTVVASQTEQSGFIVADLTKLTKLVAGVYPTRLTAIKLTSGEAIAILSMKE
jgi:hypothetical protein